jgi:two-component system, LuxR family, sensor kinase FixL
MLSAGLAGALDKEGLLTLLDAALPDALLVHDHAGRLLGANQEACRCLGYHPGEIPGLSISDISRDLDISAAQSLWRGVAPGSRIALQGHHRRKDGSCFPVDVHLGLLDHADERLYLAVFRDATEALRESEARFRATFEQAAVGLAHVGLDRRLLRANDKFCEILGMSRESLRSLLSGGGDEAVADSSWHEPQIEQALLTGTRASAATERQHRTPDGQLTWINVTVSVARNDEGNPDYFIVVMEDITQRKTLEEKSEEHGRQMDALMKEQLIAQTAAALAHELNQPLEAISAYSEVALRAMQSESGWSEQMQRAVLGCNLQAQRAGQVLHDLIGQLRTEGNDKQVFDLNTLVRDVIERVRTRESLNFQVSLSLDPALPQVTGNPLQIEKVLHNLLRNGLDAMLAAGIRDPSFAIASHRGADPLMAEVSVQDIGPGIPPELAQVLFRPFRSAKRGGLGLGLSISRSLIHAQGGQLWLERDTAPGATFRFTVPIADEH